MPSVDAAPSPGQTSAPAVAGITVEVVRWDSSEIDRPLVMDANPGQSLADCPPSEQNAERLVRRYRFLLQVTNSGAAPWSHSAVSARFTTSGGSPAFACRNSVSGLDPIAPGGQVILDYVVLTELSEGLGSGVLVVYGVGEAPIALPQMATSPSGNPSLRPSVHNNRASYRQWGKPKAADSCETDDALGATYKLDLVIELTNATAGDLNDLTGYFIGESGQKLFLCGVLPNLPSGFRKSTPVHTFADQWVQELVLTDAQGRTLARQCFAKPEGLPDVAAVACGG